MFVCPSVVVTLKVTKHLLQDGLNQLPCCARRHFFIYLFWANYDLSNHSQARQLFAYRIHNLNVKKEDLNAVIAKQVICQQAQTGNR